MPVVACPHCGKQYSVADQTVGQSVRCTTCNEVFVAANAPAPPSLPSQRTSVPAGGSVSMGQEPGVDEPTPFNVKPAVHRYHMPNTGATKADEIDYAIYGDDMQFVEVTLDPGETVIAEAGGMMFMTSGIRMETVFGDPSAEKQGFWSKVASAGKRVLTGESLFITTFSNSAAGRETVAFAAPYPGKILPFHLQELGGEMICQKDSFLCGAKGVQVGIAFQKKIGAGLFGGEGFILQRLKGDGIVMVHAGGTMSHKSLRPGEQIRFDTGCLVAMSPEVNYDIQFVGGVKNTLFGGEGLFLATVTGPGHVWFQSLPFSRLAGRVLANAPSGRGGGKDEGSVLGGLGNLLMSGGGE